MIIAISPGSLAGGISQLRQLHSKYAKDPKRTMSNKLREIQRELAKTEPSTNEIIRQVQPKDTSTSNHMAAWVKEENTYHSLQEELPTEMQKQLPTHLEVRQLYDLVNANSQNNKAKYPKTYQLFRQVSQPLNTFSSTLQRALPDIFQIANPAENLQAIHNKILEQLETEEGQRHSILWSYLALMAQHKYNSMGQAKK